MTRTTAGYRCPACHRDFPIILGIPDLRVYPDPYISLEDDRRKGALVEEQAASLGFEELVRFYWQITSGTPPDLKERFIRHVLTDEKRAENFLDSPPQASVMGGSCLEVGCGTGGFLKAASARYQTLIGCDIAFRWLVIARKRLAEAGAAANLVCCCADYLPFPENSFDSVVAISLLEHLPNRQASAVQEWTRVLQNAGTLRVVSTNRYSLAPEPHVRIWGVGLLPRRWMPAYVRWRRGLPYDKYRLPSCLELRRIFLRAGFDTVSLSLPLISEAELEGLEWFERTAGRALRSLSKIPVLRWPLLLVSPLLQVLGRKGVGQSRRLNAREAARH